MGIWIRMLHAPAPREGIECAQSVLVVLALGYCVGPQAFERRLSCMDPVHALIWE